MQLGVRAPGWLEPLVGEISPGVLAHQNLPLQQQEAPKLIFPPFRVARSDGFVRSLGMLTKLNLHMPRLSLLPRIIRFNDAPRYLGMDRNRLNAEVRPYVTEIPIGKQGIGFDRLDLDAWADDYKSRNGRPGRKGVNRWDARKYPASSLGPVSGTSTSGSSGGEFAKALARLGSKKQKGISRE